MNIRELLSKGVEGQEYEIRGWIYRTRSSGSIVFTVIRDATGVMQCTVKKSAVPPDQFQAASRALLESAVKCSGILRKDERAPGGYELQATSFQVLHFAEPFPITATHSDVFLLENRHLWVRSREQNAIMRVKGALLHGAREWFRENDFHEVTPPVLTKNACEGGTTLFSLRYFDDQAYLSQSAQFYLEALCMSLEKVYALTPSFRAEKSRTPRHLTEYWHLEAEEAFAGNEENMRIQEELVSAMVAEAVRYSRDELQLLGRNADELKEIQPPFERITYSEALEILARKGRELSWGDDFGTEEERLLTVDRSKPMFVVNFPKSIKPFYMKENEDDPRTYRCDDMLAPEGYGEIIGGSERETDYSKLVMRMKEQNLPLEPYAWYLDLRRYGSVQHSGFGLGVERVVRWLCKLEHIRDAVPFPRTPSRIYP